LNKNWETSVNKHLNKNADGWLSLNYFEPIEISGSAYLFVDELEKHRHQIEEKLVEYRDKPIVLEKYIWSAKYHNFL